MASIFWRQLEQLHGPKFYKIESDYLFLKSGIKLHLFNFILQILVLQTWIIKKLANILKELYKALTLHSALHSQASILDPSKN